MKIKKLKTKQRWLCEVDGHTYVRTEIQFRSNDKPNTITWFLKESCTQDYKSIADEELEKLFWENTTKTNNPVLVDLFNKEVKNTFNDQDMVNFLQTIFVMDGFDYEKALERFKNKQVMKNIHLVPTPTLSQGYVLGKCIKELSDVKVGQFTKTYYLMFDEEYFQPHNLYITNSEEIKEGWYFNISAAINKPVFIKNEDIKGLKTIYGEKVSHLEKITLTTDPDLINDGIQAIDDEFLEWFINNPSCEKVSIEKTQYNPVFSEDDLSYDGMTAYYSYKTIIPKEEPKPHSFCETPDEKCTMNYCDENGCQNRKRVLVEPKKETETLEEVAERILFENTKNIEIRYRGGRENVIKAMIEIAKWQQDQDKKLYSDEEVELIANEMANWVIDNIGNKEAKSGKKFDEILSKFKKK